MSDSIEPWCEICESEHNPKQAHRFKIGVATQWPVSEPSKPRFDRTAYQREYMRAYRKKKSGGCLK